jgi:DNA-3-methyladenine glycosylase II
MPETPYFEYGEREISWLKSRDPILGEAMDEIGGFAGSRTFERPFV